MNHECVQFFDDKCFKSFSILINSHRHSFGDIEKRNAHRTVLWLESCNSRELSLSGFIQCVFQCVTGENNHPFLLIAMLLSKRLARAPFSLPLFYSKVGSWHAKYNIFEEEKEFQHQPNILRKHNFA